MLLFEQMIGGNKSDAEFIQHLDKFHVKRLVGPDGIAERNIHHLIIADADHHIALSLHDGFYGSHTCAARQYTVVCCGSAATLQMP